MIEYKFMTLRGAYLKCAPIKNIHKICPIRHTTWKYFASNQEIFPYKVILVVVSELGWVDLYL